MTLTSNVTRQPSRSERGELFSLLLRLHPTEPGQVSPSSGPQVQAAFLDMVQQSDPALSAWLHTPNQRRPYTLGLLQGFNHLSAAQLEDATIHNRMVEVMPGQVYWLRITMLDATIFSSFVQSLVARSASLVVRIGESRFAISRLVSSPDAHTPAPSWVAYSSFTDLYNLRPALKRYEFEFATPTAFSKGQQAWGKMLKLFPEPASVFDSLARQWDIFAPAPLRLAAHNTTPGEIASWCEEQVIVSHYKLSTRYLPSSRFGQAGFQGRITYEVKGNPSASQALWLSTLASFALFAGVGYKTTMGMGQTRCLSRLHATPEDKPAQEGNA